ncbi:MAG: hypothetical protein ABJC07_02035 [Acidobacteriota bacterium]
MAAVRVQTGWESRRPVVHCVARLTRALSRRERAEMGRYSEFQVGEDSITYSCRPEETEAAEKRLSSLLRLVADSPGRARRPRVVPIPPR